jgi:hypothetical protein
VPEHSIKIVLAPSSFLGNGNRSSQPQPKIDDVLVDALSSDWHPAGITGAVHAPGHPPKIVHSGERLDADRLPPACFVTGQCSSR